MQEFKTPHKKLELEDLPVQSIAYPGSGDLAISFDIENHFDKLLPQLKGDGVLAARGGFIMALQTARAVAKLNRKNALGESSGERIQIVVEGNRMFALAESKEKTVADHEAKMEKMRKRPQGSARPRKKRRKSTDSDSSEDEDEDEPINWSECEMCEKWRQVSGRWAAAGTAWGDHFLCKFGSARRNCDSAEDRETDVFPESDGEDPLDEAWVEHAGAVLAAVMSSKEHLDHGESDDVTNG